MATNAEAGAAKEGGFDELKRTMMELESKIGDVCKDIGTVKEELGADITAMREDLAGKIESSNQATLELKKRMDENDKRFDDRVAEVVAKLGGVPGGSGPPGGHAAGSKYSSFFTQDGPSSSSSSSYSGGPSSGSFSSSGGRPLAGGGMLKEDQYWMCRRSLRIWPIPGKSNTEMSKSLGIFLKEKLHLSSVFLRA